jgi:hypothetical protein
MGHPTLHRVLNGCTGQKQPVSAWQTQKGLPSSGGRRFDSLRFVQDHVLPFDAREVFLVHNSLKSQRGTQSHQILTGTASSFRTHYNENALAYELIRSNEYMERTIFIKSHILPTPNPSQRFPIFRCTPIRQSFQSGYESRELLLPVMQC